MKELKNGQRIFIQLKTNATQGNEKAEFAFDVLGQLVQMGNTLYIRYIEETQEEQVPVTIKIEPDGNVQIMRGSSLHSRLKFKYQEKVMMDFRTPYGIFEMESFTKHLHFSLRDQPISGRLDLEYDLLTHGSVMGSYELQLDFHA